MRAPIAILALSLVTSCGSDDTSPAADGPMSQGTPDGSAPAACLAASLGRDHLMIGFAGDDGVAPQAPFDSRYQYISGGIADGDGPCTSCTSCTTKGTSCANAAGGCAWWGCWQYDQDPPGGFVRSFVMKAIAANEIPMITWYQLLQASGVAEGAAEVTQAATDATFMRRYFADYRFMLQQIDTSDAFIHLEPDFWGYCEQQSEDPTTLPAAVASANDMDCSGLPDTIAGLGVCMVKMAHTYAPHSLVGLHASAWSTKMDVLGNSSATFDGAAEAAKTVAFLKAAGGTAMDFVVVDYSDRDAGFYQSMGRSTWWDDTNAMLPDFTQALAWTKSIGDGLGKPVVVWQIPVGNAQGDDTCDHYKDNRVDYLMTHTTDVVRANVALLAFGAGATCQTSPSTDGGNLVAKTKALSTSGGQAICP